MKELWFLAARPIAAPSNPPRIICEHGAQASMRHLMMVDLCFRRPIPTALPQLVPQCARRIGPYGAVDALVRPGDGEHIHVLIEDHEARPTCRRAVACSHPFLAHGHDRGSCALPSDIRHAEPQAM